MKDWKQREHGNYHDYRNRCFLETKKIFKIRSEATKQIVWSRHTHPPTHTHTHAHARTHKERERERERERVMALSGNSCVCSCAKETNVMILDNITHWLLDRCLWAINTSFQYCCPWNADSEPSMYSATWTSRYAWSFSYILIFSWALFHLHVKWRKRI